MSDDDTTPPTEHPFAAEVERILDLMIHSVYSEREIFLRELVSNASDALDKRRYLAQTEPGVASSAELHVLIRPGILDRSLTVRDNGIGMSAEELARNLGTIARSGTRAFREGLADAKDSATLIGQFGVGFYSAFMVAERIEVVSRKAGTPDTSIWISEGLKGFSVRVATPEEAERLSDAGTAVTLFLKDDALSFLEDHEIERLVRTYSDHILFPVRLETLAAPDDDGDADETDTAEPVHEAGTSIRQINSARALWSRPRQEVTAEEYRDFCRDALHLFDEPALTIHYRAEGRSEYQVMLFVPRSRPFEMSDPARKGRIRLYVRRVFITEDADLVPPFLRFVRGVVDSEDMPLNISREMLQSNPMVKQIRGALTGRILNELKTLAGSDAETWGIVWQTFGAILKEGLYEEPERRDTLLELARFRTTADGDGWRTLKDYIAALRPNQTAIYYLTADTLEKAKASPQLEGYRARGVEVLLLTDPVDNFWVTNALGYDGKPFRSITQGEADLAQIEKVASSEEAAPPLPTVRIGEVIEAMRKALGEAVETVRVSTRLVESPACLVAGSHGPDRGLEKLLAMRNEAVGAKAVLEINPTHALTRRLESLLGASGQADFEDLAWIMLDEARLLEGEAPADPRRFAERLNRLLLAGG
ncbi:MAG: molecular chaperone HtpG [Hyphomicrobiaceae bacterium]